MEMQAAAGQEMVVFFWMEADLVAQSALKVAQRSRICPMASRASDLAKTRTRNLLETLLPRLSSLRLLRTTCVCHETQLARSLVVLPCYTFSTRAHSPPMMSIFSEPSA